MEWLWEPCLVIVCWYCKCTCFIYCMQSVSLSVLLLLWPIKVFITLKLTFATLFTVCILVMTSNYCLIVFIIYFQSAPLRNFSTKSGVQIMHLKTLIWPLLPGLCSAQLSFLTLAGREMISLSSASWVGWRYVCTAGQTSVGTGSRLARITMCLNLLQCKK